MGKAYKYKREELNKIKRLMENEGSDINEW